MRCNLTSIQLAIACLAAAGVLTCAAGSAETITFDDLALASNSYWNGSDLGGTHEAVIDPWNPPATMDLYHDHFISGGASFNNNYNATYPSWDGFAYSNRTDNTGGGLDPSTFELHGEYTSIAGSGQNSVNYAVGYVGTGAPPTLDFGDHVQVLGGYFTNTAYVAPTIQNGAPPYSKQFGGESGNDADWFKLTVTGENKAGASVGAVDLYLADYRSADHAQDYIVDDWTWLDLSSLGNDVSRLKFTLSSSDSDSVFGMNTPGYFAMDSLAFSRVTAPEPSAFMLLLSASAVAFAWRWRRKIAAIEMGR